MAGIPVSTVCQLNLQIILRNWKELGLSISPDKLFLSKTSLEFLDIVLDSEKIKMRISEQSLQEVLEEPVQWYQHVQQAHICQQSGQGSTMFFYLMYVGSSQDNSPSVL